MIRAMTAVVVALVLVGTAALLDPAPETIPIRVPTSSDVYPADLPIGCFGWLELPVGETGEGVLAPGASDVTRYSLLPMGYEPGSIGSGFRSEAPFGMQVERVGQGDISGLAAAPCGDPHVDQWLVGGSTRIGDSSRLVLVNPTDVESEVVATIFGPTGPIEQTVVVSMGARTTESFLLEGVAVELATLVVHVQADGAGVVAAVQDSRLNGFLPDGTDWVVPGVMPSTSMVIPGVGPSNPDGVDGPATVRLFSPEGASVSLSLADSNGRVQWPGVQGIHLEPGIPVDFDLPVSARCTVIVEADAPVVAAAITRRGRTPDEGLEGDIARDLFWIPGQDPRETSPVSIVMPPYTATIVAYASTQAVVRVRNTTTGEDLGEEVVGAGAMTEIPLSAEPGATITVEGDVTWTLLIEDEGFIAAVEPIRVASGSIAVSVIPGPFHP